MLHEFDLDDPHLFKIRANNLLRRCVPLDEAKKIIWKYHNLSYGEHFNGEKTTAKILQSSFFWPSLFKYTHALVQRCDMC